VTAGRCGKRCGMHGTFREQGELAKNRLVLWQQQNSKKRRGSHERKKNFRANKFANRATIERSG